MQSNTRLYQNDYITDPRVPDPENLPLPLGWTLMVRPYPIKEKTQIIITGATKDHMNYVTCVGRVVAVGPCCWTRPQHANSEGEYFPWVEVGDFVSWPRHAGAKQKINGVSFVTLADDDITQKLLDPCILNEQDDKNFFEIDIPEEDLKKYNTIYKETK